MFESKNQHHRKLSYHTRMWDTRVVRDEEAVIAIPQRVNILLYPFFMLTEKRHVSLTLIFHSCNHQRILQDSANKSALGNAA